MGYKLKHIEHCAECGKQVLLRCPREYVYKIDRKVYCGYTCFRKAQKPILEARRRKIKRQLKGLDYYE